MDRSKWVAIITGILSILLGVGYLILIQFLDYRGDFVPASMDTVGILFSIVI